MNDQWAQGSAKLIKYPSPGFPCRELRGKQELRTKSFSTSWGLHKGDLSRWVAGSSLGFGSFECHSSLWFKPFFFLFCVSGYILEPPPCRSDPENCTHFCTLQEDCHRGFQCCSAFCGIVCTLNKNTSRKR